MEAKRHNIANQKKLKWRSKEINVQEKVENLVGWITKFKEVVNIAVQYDPVHAALPWASYINLNYPGETKPATAIIVMKQIAFLVGLYTIYKKLYLIECEGTKIPDIAKATKISSGEH
ncbi:hypothetical protein EV426DRAFT_709264 [Tirmania nivea]|nr:hypothetical protein EV426DRAFT_709264 [Tirmania nivea]